MEQQSTPDKPLALTMGDPAGIGLELTAMLWQKRRELSLPSFILLGDPSLISARAARIGLEIPVKESSLETASDIFQSALPVFPIATCLPDTPGEINDDAGKAAITSIEEAVRAVIEKQAAAVVTNPINKKALYDVGFTHPGHTEFLGELSASHFPAETNKPVMMLASQELRTIPVTIHIPLKEVPEALTSKNVEDTIRVADHDLKKRFGISEPRIVATGLNPHAGENGALGLEDDAVIAPALEKLRSEGINVTGPHPADTLFHAAARQKYDVAVAMYHDQALVPIKTLSFDEAANITLGLPFIRTSPDHGTAFDIAGKGIARPDSLATAMKMAAMMAHNESKAE